MKVTSGNRLRDEGKYLCKEVIQLIGEEGLVNENVTILQL